MWEVDVDCGGERANATHKRRWWRELRQTHSTVENAPSPAVNRMLAASDGERGAVEGTRAAVGGARHEAATAGARCAGSARTGACAASVMRTCPLIVPPSTTAMDLFLLA